MEQQLENQKEPSSPKRTHMPKKTDQTLHDPKMIEKILEVIEEYSITTIKGIIGYLPISRSSFYDHGYDLNDIVKDAIDQKKVELKESMRTKWFLSENPTLQIALYRLLADEDEKRALNNRVNVQIEPSLFDEMDGEDIDNGLAFFTK